MGQKVSLSTFKCCCIYYLNLGFEWRYGFRFCLNSNKLDAKHDLMGRYTPDFKKNTILVKYQNSTDKPDSLLYNFKFSADSILILNTKIKNESCQLILKKQKTAYWKKE
jgi:hypothetical protein